MEILFDKMQGLGNDFIVIDGTQIEYPLNSDLIAKMSHRKYGIGCDQLLLLELSDDATADFIYRIFNADGREVEQCGNGARCILQFIHHHQLSTQNPLRLKTLKGIIECEQLDDDLVSVNMGKPQRIDGPHSIRLLDHSYEYYFVDVGNPHIVIFSDNVNPENWMDLGKQLSTHPEFTEQVNVGFANIKNVNEIDLQVYERGSGPTLACGSGACAAVAAGCEKGILQDPVTVNQRGGRLIISEAEPNGSIKMIGPACLVYKGVYKI
ncbi:MAG: diaminopimelate epimerase [Gammaproteobacteria bacterium]|nr:diaminopimelate epimerase [Gammaproteobacteria bacterium]